LKSGTTQDKAIHVKEYVI